MLALKLLGGCFLICVWTGVGWLIAHRRRIERELVQDEAMPRPTPKANFLVLIGAVLTGLSGLVLYLIFG